MKDISSKVQKTRPWAQEDALSFARQVLALLPNGRMSWDVGSGEDWIALYGGTHLVGFVYVPRNLVMLSFTESEKLSEAFSASTEVEVIFFTQYDGEPEFKMTPDLICTFSGIDSNIWESANIDPASFNANELWFLTI